MLSALTLLFDLFPDFYQSPSKILNYIHFKEVAYDIRDITIQFQYHDDDITDLTHDESKEFSHPATRAIYGAQI